MKIKALAVLFSVGLLATQPAYADEGAFLSSLKGTCPALAAVFWW